MGRAPARSIQWLLATLAMAGMTGAVLAASGDPVPSASQQQTAPNHPGWHHHRPMMGGPGMMLERPLLRAFRQLNLTTDQQQQVRDILKSAHQQALAQRRAAASGTQDFTALFNPGDPNYASAVQMAKDRASVGIQQASQIEQNLYDVLNPQQKTQLTQVLAAMQSRMQQRRSEAQQPAAAPATGGP